MITLALRNLLLLTLFLIYSTANAEGLGDCTPINAAPFVITQPGSYCLSNDISLSVPAGKAIFVKADDVNINFQGFSLTNSLARLGNTAIGVYANDRDHLEITNGELAGWVTGIKLEGLQSMGNRISGMSLYNIRGTGIDAEGTELRVSGNRFSGIGGSPKFADAIGINIGGTSPRIIDNIIRAISAGDGDAIGLNLKDTVNPYITGNTFDTFDASKISIGMKLDGTLNAIILRNTFYKFDVGIALENGSSGLTNDTFQQEVTTPTTGFGLIFIGHNF